MVLKYFKKMQINIKYIKATTLLVVALISFSFTYPAWEYNKRYNTIVKDSIIELFSTNKFLVKDYIKSDESFYVIKQKDLTLGYFVISQAPSKFHKFDYYIIYNSDAEIIKIEVLQYRENYGAEICSKKWLQKFNNISTNNYPEYNRQVDGISGATISVNSIKVDIYKSSNILKKRILAN